MRMRSLGAFEFGTKPSHFGRIGGRIRLMAERGETHLLPLQTSETMTATEAGYSEELYEISCRVFGPIGASIWDRDYFLRRPVSKYDITISLMKEMYEHITDKRNYVAVKWGRHEDTTLRSYAQGLMDDAGRKDVRAWTFLLNKGVLYVRRSFLESFEVGVDIINYVRMLNKARREREANQNRKR